jgi:Aspartate carbamoyltransferase regulatory chain, metal binding domain
LSESRSFTVEIPGKDTMLVLGILRDETDYLTSSVDWSGTARIEFSSKAAPPLLIKIQLVSPEASIRERRAGKDYPIDLVPPNTIIEDPVIICPNKNCVTAQPKEPTKPSFRVVSWKPPILQCSYCGRYIDEETIRQHVVSS